MEVSRTDHLLVIKQVSINFKKLKSSLKTILNIEKLIYIERDLTYIKLLKDKDSFCYYKGKAGNPIPATSLFQITQGTCLKVEWSISGPGLYTGMFFQFLEDL